MKITRFDSTYLLASVKLAGGNFLKLSALPGYSKWNGRSLLFRPTSMNIAYIQEHWPESEWDEESQPHLDRTIAAKESGQEGTKVKQLSLKEMKKDNFKYGTKPYDHQRKAFLISRERKSYALFMEQGTGKTKVIIDTAAYLYQQGEIDMMIVLAPNGVHENWVINELPKHAPPWLKYNAWIYSPSTAKYRLEERERALDFDGFRIIAINIEGFSSDKAKELLERCLHVRCLMVVDESSRIKNPASKRSRYLNKIGRKAAVRRILSGTPITQGLEDLYSQFLFLDPDILGFDTFTTYKSRYCIIKKLDFGEMILGYKNEEEIIEKVDGYSFRVLKSECLDLPEKIYKKWPVHLSKKQSVAYQELMDDYMTELEGETLTAELAMVRLLRLQQIICGWFPTDSGKFLPIEICEIHPRIKALKAILQDVEGKVVIWARFIADLDLIEYMLNGNDEAIRYRGKIEAANQFQNDPSIKYFIANPASGGLGITLTAAETVIYYSNSFDLEHRLQSEDRTHRIGTKGNVTYIDLCAIGTVDVRIVEALRSKKLVSDAILQDPHEFFLEYEDE